MDISVGLVCFARHGRESFVLLENRGNVYGLPESPLLEWRSSYYIVKSLIETTLGITGSWAEIDLGLTQMATFDDVDRNPSKREILIVYSLFLADKTSLKDGYEWVNIEEMENLYLDHENIIRYGGANGNGKVHA